MPAAVRDPSDGSVDGDGGDLAGR